MPAVELDALDLSGSAIVATPYEDRFFDYSPELGVALRASGVVAAKVGTDRFFDAALTASGNFWSILLGLKPPWVVIYAPTARMIFRRIDFGTIDYNEPEALDSDEIDEIVLANTDGAEENNIDFLRRNDGWFVSATAVEFPAKPYELTFIYYDDVERKTYSRTKRFFFKRELPNGLAGKPEKTLVLPLARNVFRRVNFGSISYTNPSALTSTAIDEIVVGNMDINDLNQIDFLLRYDGWFVSAYLVDFPKEPYEITFIRHDNANQITYSASARLKLQREVKIT